MELLKEDNTNPNGYFLAGEALESVNRYQAYLCYENAAFWDKQGEIKVKAKEKMEYLSRNGWGVRKASIVILNYNLVNMLKDCIESIRSTTPSSARDIIIIDNGSTDGSKEYLDSNDDIIAIKNSENVGFPRGCNQGIEIADSETDIFLLNNDIIMCDNTLFWLRMALYESDKHGCAGCVTNNIGHNQAIIEKDLDIDEYIRFSKQINVPNSNAYEYRPFLVGFALLIKRDVIRKVGLLDEIYTPGNYEDNDYGIRCLAAGYQNVLVHNSFIIHLGSKSFGVRKDFGDILARNHSHFDSKFGMDSDYDLTFYSGVYLIKDYLERASEYKSVLHVGCSMASDMLRLKWEHPDMHLEGVGNDIKVANYSSRYEGIHVSYCNDLIEYQPILEKYDLIVINIGVDDPISLQDYICYYKKYCSSYGRLVINIDNKRYYKMWLPTLLTGQNARKMINGIACEHDADGDLVANGLGLEKWIMFFWITEDKNEKAMVEKLSDVVEEGYRIKCKKYAIVTYVTE